MRKAKLRSSIQNFRQDCFIHPNHEQFVTFLKQSLWTAVLTPSKLLEVGASLGRTFYEICGQIESVKEATLLEPSQNLASTFNQIFTSEQKQAYPVPKGNRDLAEIDFDTSEIRG